MKLFEDLLFGKIPNNELIYDYLIPLNKSAQTNRIVDSEMVGGNLTLIQAAIDTFCDVRVSHRILFLEDCDLPHVLLSGSHVISIASI